ncbi:MAG: ATP-dependent Clp protease adaptor ClpS [Ichthyobacteriaceae bacterium]|nr:ATP-dependent Clp protease adaptor ClpS [Ichthyobacteriaceae bacterium]
MNPEIETLIEEHTEVKRTQKHQIILHNDEENTFEFVIESLITVCGHTSEQAEQCAMITHYNGKCGISTGVLNELKPICTRLLSLGLSVEIM